ncbi:MAG: HAD-IC family P-type ATPase, partial [Bacilli bacterium]|nr:HAD-IC family P-type ATPase [Bacilli bacterium]
MLFSKKPDDIEKLINQAPKYEPDFKSGLNTEQILDRVKDNLVNHQRKTVTKSYFEIIFKNIFTVLNALLFAVAGCMIWLIAIGKAPLSRLFFFGILILNILISLFQDIKARILVSKLTLISSPRASVVRNGNQKTIPFNEIVLSDIIVIKAGEVIPCDAKIVHGAVRLNESMLSGETDDVNKQTGDTVYAESVVTGGYGYARVKKISSANYASRLQEKSREFSRPKSEILSSLTYIIRVISVIAIVLGTAEIISYASLGRDLLESVDSIGSSIVAMIPMGMYLMTSITLTVGVIILAGRRILVRELYSIEMLARVNIVCLDKTGTLTDGNMEVTDLISCSNRSVDYLKNMISHLLYITKDDNLTARALKSKFSIKSIKGDYSAIPFNSEQKFSAASFNKHTYVLGAYGFIKLSNDKAIKSKITTYEKQGARVLIIAESNHIINKNKLPNDLKGVGFLVFKESIKLDAKANIEWLRQSNTAIRIISGDSVESLKAIANGVGLKDHRAISLSGLSESETKKAVHNHEIFARVTPEQKKIIINELRSMGNTVA